MNNQNIVYQVETPETLYFTYDPNDWNTNLECARVEEVISES